MTYFETRFLDEAKSFLMQLDEKAVRKVLYNIDLAAQTNDPKLFKKLRHDIWEFRTTFARKQIRLLAFWDKTAGKQTLVIATHGFLKKGSRIPDKEIQRAIRLRNQYLQT